MFMREGSSSGQTNSVVISAVWVPTTLCYTRFCTVVDFAARAVCGGSKSVVCHLTSPVFVCWPALTVDCSCCSYSLGHKQSMPISCVHIGRLGHDKQMRRCNRCHTCIHLLAVPAELAAMSVISSTRRTCCSKHDGQRNESGQLLSQIWPLSSYDG